MTSQVLGLALGLAGHGLGLGLVGHVLDSITGSNASVNTVTYTVIVPSRNVQLHRLLTA